MLEQVAEDLQLAQRFLANHGHWGFTRDADANLQGNETDDRRRADDRLAQVRAGMIGAVEGKRIGVTEPSGDWQTQA